ncbi:MAG: hypothetical protein IT320_14015 [Anaerolineae bacterium]|nr:hypothetical protein [Anaerolineae bacterium]
MSSDNRRLEMTTWIILVVLMLLTVAARILPDARTIDDAFITFRYSRNIVDGLGFVYNPGVHTLGTTTPLFTLLMALISVLTGQQDFPHYAMLISALADAGNVLALYLLTRRLTGNAWIGFIPAGLWAIAPVSVTFAVGGMETSLNILWMLSATAVFVLARDRSSSLADIVLGLLIALGILTRIDSLLWVAPLLGWQAVERLKGRNHGSLLARLPWRTWLSCVLVFLPWAIFSLAYFGSPFPNSLAAKTVAYVLPPDAALLRLIQHYAVPFNETDVFTPLNLALGIIYALFTVIAVAVALRRLPRLVPFLVYPWIYFVVFAIANPLLFRWYLAPPLPALMLGIVSGMWLCAGQAFKGRLRPVIPVLFVLMGIWWSARMLSGWTLHPDHGPDRPAPTMAWHQIELYYQQIGTMLRDDYGVTAETRVASADIGAIGYFTGATIVDTVGLVTPELSRYYPVDPSLIVEGQNYAIPPQLILDAAPEYFVTMEAFVRLGLENEAAFTTNYDLLFEIPTDFYGMGMRLYGRVR